MPADPKHVLAALLLSGPIQALASNWLVAPSPLEPKACQELREPIDASLAGLPASLGTCRLDTDVRALAQGYVVRCAERQQVVMIFRHEKACRAFVKAAAAGKEITRDDLLPDGVRRPQAWIDAFAGCLRGAVTPARVAGGQVQFAVDFCECVAGRMASSEKEADVPQDEAAATRMAEQCVAEVLAAPAAAPPGPATRPDDPMAGCAVTDESPGEYALLCPGAFVTVARFTGSVEAFTARLQEASRQVDPKVTRTGGEALVAGANRPAIRLAFADGARWLWVTAIDAGGPRALGCQHRDQPEAACLGVLSAAWAWPTGEQPPASIPRATAKLLAGRQVEVPAGCELAGTPGSGLLTCPGGAQLAWRQLQGDGDDFPGNWLAPYRARGVTQRVQPCAIEGAPTTCTLIGPRGGTPEVTAGSATVRGTRVFVACVHGTGAADLPPACSGVLRLLPPASPGG